MVALRSVRTLVLSAGGAVLLVGLLFGVLLPSAHAQSQRADDMFYGRLGGGLSDFTSDLSSWRPTHPFGGGKFTRGAGPPFVFVGEVGYQFSPHWALGIGIQGGNYPVEVYPEIEGISDSYRYTPRVLGRYTMGAGPSPRTWTWGCTPRSGGTVPQRASEPVPPWAAAWTSGWGGRPRSTWSRVST
ncbi:hypothetical protein [Salinibacter ruber]|uniref:hypothetical protein n=1 Tax=Salinibacter ruber TaxID=146919 RepID=UPI00216909C6|nr:hypothetical protein [Salinibacter ruber]MCS4200611.1 hypothetical protein [Salinibacter ruber]